MLGEKCTRSRALPPAFRSVPFALLLCTVYRAALAAASPDAGSGSTRPEHDSYFYRGCLSGGTAWYSSCCRPPALVARSAVLCRSVVGNLPLVTGCQLFAVHHTKVAFWIGLVLFLEEHPSPLPKKKDVLPVRRTPSGVCVLALLRTHPHHVIVPCPHAVLNGRVLS